MSTCRICNKIERPTRDMLYYACECPTKVHFTCLQLYRNLLAIPPFRCAYCGAKFKLPVFDSFYMDYRMLVPMGLLPNFEELEQNYVDEPYELFGSLYLTKKGERTYHIHISNKLAKTYTLCVRYHERTQRFDRELPAPFTRFSDGANYFVMFTMASHKFIWIISKLSLCKYRVFCKYGLWFEIDA